jgi:hypothetical protein
MKVLRLRLTNIIPLIEKQINFNAAITKLYYGSNGKQSRIPWKLRSTL